MGSGPGDDQQAGNEECQFSRCEGQWHAGLLSKEQACQQRQRDRSMEALKKAHGCILPGMPAAEVITKVADSDQESSPL